MSMAAYPLPLTTLVVLFGHDPTVIGDRCETLRSGGYECVVTTTASEAEGYLSSKQADVLLVGSQTGPLTRLRLAEKARENGVAVVHISYYNHPAPGEDEIYVMRPVGASELLDAMNRAIRHNHKRR